MLLLGLKKCAFHTQTRKLVTLSKHITRVSVKKVPTYHCTDLKYPYLLSPSLSLYRLINTNPKEGSGICLRPLMWQPRYEMTLPVFSTIFWYIIIRLRYDKTFRLMEFMEGATKAVLMVSSSLATRNYEMLEGLIKERTLKILKHRVDLLTSAQRELINVEAWLSSYPGEIRIKHIQGSNDKILEIEVWGIYTKDSQNTFVPQQILLYYYTFQRRYSNGIGSPWILQRVNHSTLN